jgi:hypothetical protein
MRENKMLIFSPISKVSVQKNPQNVARMVKFSVLASNFAKDTKMQVKSKSYRVNPSLSAIGLQIDEIKTNGRKKLVDKRHFLKVYLYAGALSQFNELSNGARSILAFVLEKQLRFNEHEVIIKPAFIVQELQLDRSTVSRAINELVLHEWIFRSNIPFSYWLNLERVCYGNSEIMYEEYRRTILK